MKTVNETHTLLKEFASTFYTLTPTGTIDQLTSWYERHTGVRVSERTFQRHTRQLVDTGIISVRHSRRYTSYTLLRDEVEVPKVKFLPTSDPGQFLIEESGAETVSYAWLLDSIDSERMEFSGALPF